MRPIYFVKYFEKASTVMGADQMAQALRGRGLAAESVSHSELASVSGSIVVFIKRSSLPDVVRLRFRYNRLVLDVHDRLVFKLRLRNRSAMAAVIFRNRRQLTDYGNGSKDRLIYHHWDPRYRPHEAGEDELRLGYFGVPRSLGRWDDLPGVTYVGQDWWEHTPRFNAHLSLRKPGREYRYKPNAKVSTAAACGAVLLTTPDEAAVELLGEDYPFYVEPLRDAVVDGVERLKRAIGGPEWKDALRRMERIREDTALEAITDQYVDLLEDLS